MIPTFGRRLRHALTSFDALRLGLLLLLFIPVLSAFREQIADTDLWWHLKQGEWIVAERAVPWKDPFSFTAAGHPWIAYSWLAEVLQYEMVSYLGYGALLWMKGLAGAAILGFVWAACRAAPARPEAALAIAALAALGTSGGWGERPQLFTFLLLAFLVWLLREPRMRRWLPWIAPPLFALWANVHILFAVGIAVIGVEAASATLCRQPSRALWIALVLGGVATLATPYGIHLLAHLPTIARQPRVVPAVVEFQSPNFATPYGIFIGIFLLASLAVIARSDEPLSLSEVVLFLGSLAMGFYMVRNMPLFAILAAPVVARRLDGLLPARPPAARTTPGRGRLILHYGLLAATLALTASFAPRNADWRANVVPGEFPVAAADYVDKQFMGHRIFNNFEWGGFLIFRLFPRFQVSIDGRTQVYGARIFSEYTSAHYLTAGWWRFLEESKPDVVLWPSHGALAEKLRGLPGWRVVFDDGIAVVLVRSGVQEKIRMYLPRYDPRPIRIGNHRKIGPPPLGMLSAAFTRKAVKL